MQIAQDADRPQPEIRIRWLCPACGKWIERNQPVLVRADVRLAPVDANAFQQYGLDVYSFEREHHDCYMDTGEKIRALPEGDQEFFSLDPEKRRD